VVERTLAELIPGRLEPRSDVARVRPLSAGERPGLAIDLGTTTIAARLVALPDGAPLAHATTLNPQVFDGRDVMSRIACGGDAAGLARLRSSARSGIGGLLQRLCSAAGCPTDAVDRAVIAGNATMLQLLLGIDPSPLGVHPFEASERGHRELPASALGLPLAPDTAVYLPPVPHAFFGADAAAGLLVTGLLEPGAPRLLLDLGTNGELALVVGGRRLCTSTAASPAFEGFGLSCGMRAVPGAVDSARLEAGELILGTIGGLPPRGVCGSGLIDLLACLRRADVLDRTGRMRRPARADGLPSALADRLVERDGRAAFRLDGDLLLEQRDVRQLQLAKGAVRAALDVLVHAAGIDLAAIEELALAGAFGKALDPAGLEAIGMIPPGLGGRTRIAGNASLAGATRLLVEPAARATLAEATTSLELVELSRRPEFEDLFLAHMGFPS
jgi:uncharacterized 2Fe-2S/4Fe-4S cluster protein (DUF4445 family)